MVNMIINNLWTSEAIYYYQEKLLISTKKVYLLNAYLLMNNLWTSEAIYYY